MVTKYAKIIFLTGFSKRPIDRNGAILKLESVGNRLYWNNFKTVAVLKEDYGIRSQQIKCDLETQIALDPDKNQIPLSFDINFADEELHNDERYFSMNNNLSKTNDRLYLIKFFNAADDDSALLLNELGEI